MRIRRKRERDTRLRFTGASVSMTGVGVNWQFDKSVHRQAREILHRLENHRMLYDPYEAENVQPVIESAERLRDYLTEQISQCDSAALRDHLRDMQAAVRECLTRIYRAQRDINGLWPAVRGLRCRVGTTAEAIASEFGIPLDGDLARIVEKSRIYTDSPGDRRQRLRARAVRPTGAPLFPDCPACGAREPHIRWTEDNLRSRFWWCIKCDHEWMTRWPPAPSGIRTTL